MLPEGRTTVGRDSGSHIVINDDSVSRHHAALTVSGGRLELADLGSRNHTYQNGEIVDRADLACGDQLMFGSVAARVEEFTEQIFDEWAPRAMAIRRSDGSWSDADAASVIDAPRVMRLLSDIARTLVTTLALDDILERVFDLLFAHLPAERVCLLLPQATTGTLSVHMARWRDGRPAEHPVISRTVLATTTKERVALVAVDLQADKRFDPSWSIYSSNMRSLMCGPLYASDELIGVLHIDNKVTTQFSEADLELFTAFANYAAVAIARARMAEQLDQERRRREGLQRYHSPAIVDRVLRRQTDDDLLELQERDVSVLFADIVGFTALAESHRPSDVAAFLNGFYSEMVEAIFQEEGTVDKFLGDAVLAIFGAPIEQPDHAWRAVRAVRAMKDAVARLNTGDRLTDLHVRYAINSGVAIVGDVGSSKRREYTALGDVVNIAARLKDEAKPDQLVISRTTYDRVRAQTVATSLGEIAVKGRAGRVGIYAVDGLSVTE